MLIKLIIDLHRRKFCDGHSIVVVAICKILQISQCREDDKWRPKTTLSVYAFLIDKFAVVPVLYLAQFWQSCECKAIIIFIIK